MTTTETKTSDGTGNGVRSVERAFEVLEVLARNGGALSLAEIAAATARPAPSVHRLVRTLVGLGYVRQEASRRYALAPGLIRLGDSAAKQYGTWANPVLAGLVDEIGESANMATLQGAEALYVAQVAGRHAMRMFTEVGRRVPLHCTGVGKALLVQLPEREVEQLLDLTGMPAATEQTITDPGVLLQELAAGRARGYLTEEGEREVGVSCVSVPIPGAPTLTALSFSGPTPRMTPEVVRRAAAVLQTAARTLTEHFTAERTTGS
ncbi:IclR family transcriptional regulator [Pseudonocardia sp. RS11V-5]|uniref:IclR family transcriptional regulator n=1 Tax=Pseudonocardia terrae TaxID=2905831 RepID=UPI001E552D2F|nr:IclR family transcriptional regulator [Pseudonocardia terrae]MCE3552785.1 IclR family transcriptional regulator [Pseudonocardia terrae]